MKALLLVASIAALLLVVVSDHGGETKAAPTFTPCSAPYATGSPGLLCDFDRVIQPGYPGDDIRGGA